MRGRGGRGAAGASGAAGARHPGPPGPWAGRRGRPAAPRERTPARAGACAARGPLPGRSPRGLWPRFRPGGWRALQKLAGAPGTPRWEPRYGGGLRFTFGSQLSDSPALSVRVERGWGSAPHCYSRPQASLSPPSTSDRESSLRGSPASGDLGPCRVLPGAPSTPPSVPSPLPP